MKRSMMLVLFMTGCACCKKNDVPVCPPNGAIFYPKMEQLPPAGLPTPLPPKVKILDITPLHEFPPFPDPEPSPPVIVPQWQEKPIVFPKDGNPYVKTKFKTSCKFTVTENPPYNGAPNINYEVFWNW